MSCLELKATPDREHHRLCYVEAFERIVRAFTLSEEDRAKHTGLLKQLLEAATFHRMWYVGAPAYMVEEWCGNIESIAREQASWQSNPSR